MERRRPWSSKGPISITSIGNKNRRNCYQVCLSDLSPSSSSFLIQRRNCFRDQLTAMKQEGLDNIGWSTMLVLDHDSVAKYDDRGDTLCLF